jgi:hemolysin activation/secretion protein
MLFCKLFFTFSINKLLYGLLIIITLISTEKKLKAQVIKITDLELRQQAQAPTIQPRRQTTEPPSTQPLPEPSLPYRLPPPEELLNPPSTTPSLPVTPENEVPQTIIVEGFKVTGSTVFSQEDFAKLLQPYTNRAITLAELFQARAEVTNLYVNEGYITSGAYIPPQQLQDGVVEIRVLEGKLEDIKVTGNRRLNPNYVRSRIAIATGKPLNRNRLLEGLQLLQLNPLIENLSAELSAGLRPGESVLEVQITEAETFNTQFILDNGRSPAVGSFRRQIQLSEANLLGWGDAISAGYTNTDGSDSVDLSYILPFNPRNGTISFSYGTTDSNIIERPFNTLDIQSDSRYYELTLRQPVIEKPTQEFALGITASRRESEATLQDGEFPFQTLGADEEGRTRISAVRFFQEWTSRNSQQVFALRSQFSFGVDALGSTINETAPDSRFFSWRGQAQWVRLLAPNTLLVLRTDVQLADRPLVPFEQIGLGGLESIRGYRQDALLTDNGIFASAEVRIPIVRFSNENNFLQLTPFFDFGTGWNRSGRTEPNANPDTNTLISVGLGLRLQLEDNLTARFEWGIPLISIPGEKDSWQENGLYFSIVANPF